MKFLCSNCKAKYQIPDEKIAGRTLKMDCRRCNTPITIRGDQPQPEEIDAEPADPQPRPAAPASASARSRPGASSVGRPAGSSSGGSSVGAHPAGAGMAPRSGAGRSALGADFRRNVGGAGGLAHAAEAPRVTPLDQWHVAINDVPVGPMKRDEIARKIAAGAANADSLAWREGFDDWRPIREIPELAALLRRATHDSDRPSAAGRPGAPRAPAPRAPAPRTGGVPAPGARSPLGAPAAARTSARNNVVPIGGRHGASVAPSYEPDDGDDDELSEGEGEATTIASAAELGLGDFGKSVRDDGDIPSPHGREAKKEDRPAGKGPTGGFKAIPPPGAKSAPAAPASRVAAPASKPAAPAPRPVAPVAARVAPLDDPFGLPPAEPEPKRASFAPPPAAMDPPVAFATSPSKPIPVTPVREQRGAGLGVGAMMGIGFAMAAGAVLMYGVVQRFVLSPPPPTTTVVATVATVVPPASEAQHDAVLDDVPPPTTALVAPPTTEVAPPPTSTVATATTPHHTGATPGTGTRPPTTRTPAGADPFAAFADDGAGPAPIATTTTARHDDVAAAHHSSAELTADQINAVRRGGQRALTQCWEGALRTAGHVDGDVRYDIDITIGTSGTVTLVHARGPTVGTLQDCLERAVRRWVFPPSASVTQTAFPIVFSAQQ